MDQVYVVFLGSNAELEKKGLVITKFHLNIKEE